MTPRRLLGLLLVLTAGLVVGSSGHLPAPAWAATCADYPNQAAAQAAGDTRDADGDGIYCESLPCPCSTDPPVRTPPATTTAPPPSAPPGPSTPPIPSVPPPTPAAPAPPTPTTSATTTPAAGASSSDPAGCTTPSGVQNVTFSRTKYPNIRRHFLAALRKGWPRTLVLNRDGAAERRARLLEGVATKRGYDRDEYPPAVGRGQGKGLTRGVDPTGWRADVKLVPSKENPSDGSTMGLKLRRFCNGTKFRYVFY
jgi:hypothetical protein